MGKISSSIPIQFTKFRFSFPRDLHVVFIYMKMGKQLKKSPESQIIDIASGSYSVFAVRNGLRTYYREYSNSVLPQPYSLGKFIPLMILSSQNEITATYPTNCWLVLKALWTIIKGNTLYFITEKTLG